MTRTAYMVQRDFALSSGLRSEIIWDSLSPEQWQILKQKIQTLLPDSDSQNSNAIAKQREELFQNIWQQRKYTNRTLLSAIIYVLVTDEPNTQLALQATTFSCHPVFRTRKCTKFDNSDGCCMIFIDEHGRVYENWLKFVLNNTLPKGTMIAPAHGVYTFSDNDDAVQLECHPTTSTRLKHKILGLGDTVASVGGLVATVPIAAALALPVAAPIMLAATALSITTAAYSTLRSATTLVDRRRHCQSTALTNRAARNSWLGVAGGVVGLGATGATKALTYAATAGKDINLVTKLAVNSINVSSIVITGSGVVNGFYDLYMKINDEQKLTGLDLLQVASSLLIFTHSINNLKIATKVKTANGVTIRRLLREQARKAFDKISRENVKLHPSSSSSGHKLDIIRTLNEIPFKDILLSLHTMNGHLSSGATALAALGSQLIPQLISVGAGGNMELNLQYLADQFGCKFVQHIFNSGNFLDVIRALAKYLCERAVRFFMNLTVTFVNDNLDHIDRRLNTFISTETVLYRMLMHCVQNYADFSYEFLESKTTEIFNEIEKYFESLNPVNYTSQRIECKTCNGHYYVIDL